MEGGKGIMSVCEGAAGEPGEERRRETSRTMLVRECALSSRAGI